MKSSLISGRVFSDEHWKKFGKQKDRPDREKIAELVSDYTFTIATGDPSWILKTRTASEFIDKILALFSDKTLTECVGLENCCDLKAKIEEAKREAKGN